MTSLEATFLAGTFSFGASTFEPARPTAVEPPSPPPAPAAEPTPAAPTTRVEVRHKPDLTPEQEHQAALLRNQGVAAPQSAHLARTCSAEAIRRALDDFGRQEHILRPGGWLFSGLASGRYTHEPAPLPTPSDLLSEAEQVHQREAPRSHRRDSGTASHDARLEAVRRRNAEADRADQLRLEQQTQHELEALDRLTPVQYHQLEQRARTRPGALINKASLRGAMLFLLQTQGVHS